MITSNLIITELKIIFIIFNYLIILNSVYFTTHEIIECIEYSCFNDSSYNLLLIIINCILLLDLLFVINFDTNKCRLQNNFCDDKNKKYMITNGFARFIKGLLSLIVFLSISFNIVIFNSYRNDNNIIALSVITIYNILIIIRFLFLQNILTFRHYYICIITIIALICNNILMNAMYYINSSLKKINVVSLAILIGCMSIGIIIIIYCSNNRIGIEIINENIQLEVEIEGVNNNEIKQIEGYNNNNNNDNNNNLKDVIITVVILIVIIIIMVVVTTIMS